MGMISHFQRGILTHNLLCVINNTYSKYESPDKQARPLDANNIKLSEDDTRINKSHSQFDKEDLCFLHKYPRMNCTFREEHFEEEHFVGASISRKHRKIKQKFDVSLDANFDFRLVALECLPKALYGICRRTEHEQQKKCSLAANQSSSMRNHRPD